jgi:two-component system, chemotaxis family, response regulator PixG
MVSNNLLDELRNCTQIKYSGSLNIQSYQGQNWTLYYRFGRIIWASGGTHPGRRWRRQITQHCPGADINKTRLTANDVEVEYWDYKLLTLLYGREEIDSKQVETVAENIIVEVLFDIAQNTNLLTVQGAACNCARNPKITLDLPINFVNTNVFIQRMEKEWRTWSESGLTRFSPNLAPFLKQPEELKQIVTPNVYSNFVNLLNGKYSLRDLAIKMRQGVLQITCSLLPYIENGYVQLVEVADFSLPGTETQSKQSAVQPQVANAPLIACIDDSPQVCQMLESIITSNRMRFVKIQDAVQALPLLLEHKPDFIFLDLVMPVVNGYELCTQIRRISHFANTPVVILTGSDGLVDRVRAKLVGSTDFMSKPVIADKVLTTVRKYLHSVLTSAEC